ncbi:3-beta hydroxysteroid dehydrogenase [Candidatus Marinamargulisbacteria bacterium SCGC AG-410-N11]|nr:3-beta hydroxysteroid dehydrogenase [Candidatus Marinamargulisbacteria bacterium SCGC AG-410-N11]
MKNILLIGGTGFTGKHILKKLITSYSSVFNISLFVRSKEKIHQLNLDTKAFNIFQGNLDDLNSLEKALHNQHIVIYVASLGFGHARALVKKLEMVAPEKVIFTSTTGIFTNLNPKSKSIRIDAEKIIRESKLNYTIIRPTMIYGKKDDRNISRLINFIRKSPIIPVFGNGLFLQQPIYVEDLADAILSAATTNKSNKKEYNVSGKSPVTYRELINIINKTIKTSTISIYIPKKLSLFIVSTFRKILPNFPIKEEQILRLNENKNFNHSAAINDLNFTPLSVEEGIKKQLQDMRLTS